MKFRILSHAGLQVVAGGVELLCDPWLVGSCYWRSWWNYPPVADDLVRSLKPDVIYLTHLHWDHFQGPSLRLFPKTTRIVVPCLRYDRLSRDLREMGFTNITELRHGELLELAPGFTLQSFQIGPVFADSAVVIRADNTVILNANDAKLAGLPLRQILKAYPSIDFCLRSHSSANARNCLHVIGEPDVVQDDNEHYLRAFTLFMNRVRPKYAIPFASNSCFLHRDVVGMNHLVQTPLKVSEYFKAFAATTGLQTQLRVMVSGDSWSDSEGFQIRQHDYFENRDAHIQAYLQEQTPKLNKFYEAEGRVRVTEKMLRNFVEGLRKRIPRLLRWILPREPVLIVSRGGAFRDHFIVNLRAGTVVTTDESAVQSAQVRAEFPSFVLFQSIKLNMFSHAWISKRVHYYATRDKQAVLGQFIGALEHSEAEIFPLRHLWRSRSARALLPRWREGCLYAHAIWHVLRGRSLLQAELRLLAGGDYDRVSPALGLRSG